MMEQNIIRAKFLDFRNGRIDKSSFSRFMYSVLEVSEDEGVVNLCMRMLRRINQSNVHNFKILEAHAISSEHFSVRKSSITALIELFPKQAERVISHLIEFETSGTVLNTLSILLKERRFFQRPYLKLEKRLDKISKLYGIAPRECLFFMDLKIAPEFFYEHSYHRISWLEWSEDLIFVAKDGFTRGIDFSKLTPINLLTETIGNLTRLYHLILSNTNIKTLPRSFRKLYFLKKLTLRETALHTTPFSLIQLAKQNFSKKYTKEGVFIKDAVILGLMEALSDLKLKKMEYNKAEKMCVESDLMFNYSINNVGRVIGIYL